MWFNINYDETVAKLKSGQKLSEEEIETLRYKGYCVDETEGDDHRWTRDVSTIVDIDGELWRIDWERGLTEMQDNAYWRQPYKVKRVEEEVTIVTVRYESI